MTYQEFIQRKRILMPATGHDTPTASLNEHLFDWQKDIVRWNLRKGRSASFEECGLGKTIQQLAFAHDVCRHENTNVIVLAPLAVAAQTMAEGERFGIPARIIENQADIDRGIHITNYEKLDKFDFRRFGGVVLDESSILKSIAGATRQALTDRFENTPYKLCCSATPAPNDFMEIGNHAEFLGVMSRSEMLSTFFVHDGGDTAKWRLKGHAEDKFWEWIASWACAMQKPSDLGYSDDGYILPPLEVYEHIVRSIDLVDADGQMRFFAQTRQTLNERRAVRKYSINERVAEAARIANAQDDQFVVWCDLNDESAKLTAAIRDAVEVKGSDSDRHKTDAMMGFTRGEIRVLVSKPSIAGWGMNWQNCHNTIYTGLSDSFEAYYQSLRRFWRFGQKHKVNAHLVLSEAEGAVKANIERKQRDAMRMTRELIKHTKNILAADIRGTARMSESYHADRAILLPDWIGGKAG